MHACMRSTRTRGSSRASRVGIMTDEDENDEDDEDDKNNNDNDNNNDNNNGSSFSSRRSRIRRSTRRRRRRRLIFQDNIFEPRTTTASTTTTTMTTTMTTTTPRIAGDDDDGQQEQNELGQAPRRKIHLASLLPFSQEVEVEFDNEDGEAGDDDDDDDSNSTMTTTPTKMRRVPIDFRIYLEAAGYVAVKHFNQRSAGDVLPHIAERLRECRKGDEELEMEVSYHDSRFSPLYAARHLSPLLAAHQLGLAPAMAESESTSCTPTPVLSSSSSTTTESSDSSSSCATPSAPSMSRSNPSLRSSLPPPFAILGAARSAVSETLAILAGVYGVPQVSPTSTAASLDNKEIYPFFGRTVPSNEGDAIALLSYFRSLAPFLRDASAAHTNAPLGGATPAPTTNEQPQHQQSQVVPPPPVRRRRLNEAAASDHHDANDRDDSSIATRELQRSHGDIAIGQDGGAIKHMGVIYIRDAYGDAFHRGVLKEAATHNVTVVSAPFNHDGGTTSSIQSAIERIKDSGVRYIFGIFNARTWKTAVLLASEAGILGLPEYVWIFGEGSVELTQPGFQLQRRGSDGKIARAIHGSGVLTLDLPPNVALDKQLEELEHNPLIQKDFISKHIIEDDHSDFNDTNNYTQIRDAFFEGYQFRYPGTSFYQYSNYDAVMALALAACHAHNSSSTSLPSYSSSDNKTDDGDDMNPPFTGPKLYDALLQTEFEGVTGYVSFDAATGTRKADDLRYRLHNILLLPFKDEDEEDNSNNRSATSTPSFSDDTYYRFKSEIAVKIDLRFEEQQQRVIMERDFVYWDNRTAVPQPLAAIDNPELNLIPLSIRIMGLTLCAGTVGLSVVWCVWTILCRKTDVVRVAQPIFLCQLCVGTFLMACTIIPMSFQEPTPVATLDIMCMTSPWLITIGFITSFSALFSKSWRLNLLFQKGRGFRRIKVKAYDVIYPFVTLLVVNASLLTAWTVVSPLRWTRVNVDNFDAFGRHQESFGQCQGDGASSGGAFSWIFPVLIAVVNAKALIFTNWQCYKTRTLPTDFNESFYVALTNASLLEAMILGGPILWLVNDSPPASFLVKSIVITIICLCVLLPLFVPKFLQRKLRQQRRQQGLKQKGLTVGTGTAKNSTFDSVPSTIRPSSATIRTTKTETLELPSMTSSSSSTRTEGAASASGGAKRSSIGINPLCPPPRRPSETKDDLSSPPPSTPATVATTTTTTMDPPARSDDRGRSTIIRNDDYYVQLAASMGRRGAARRVSEFLMSSTSKNGTAQDLMERRQQRRQSAVPRRKSESLLGSRGSCSTIGSAGSSSSSFSPRASLSENLHERCHSSLSPLEMMSQSILEGNDEEGNEDAMLHKASLAFSTVNSQSSSSFPGHGVPPSETQPPRKQPPHERAQQPRFSVLGRPRFPSFPPRRRNTCYADLHGSSFTNDEHLSPSSTRGDERIQPKPPLPPAAAQQKQPIQKEQYPQRKASSHLVPDEMSDKNMRDDKRPAMLKTHKKKRSKRPSFFLRELEQQRQEEQQQEQQSSPRLQRSYEQSFTLMSTSASSANSFHSSLSSGGVGGGYGEHPMTSVQTSAETISPSTPGMEDDSEAGDGVGDYEDDFVDAAVLAVLGGTDSEYE